MGMHAEVTFEHKTPNGWVYADSDYDIPQSYDLYAWLAGVRNRHNVASVAELRGRVPEYVKNADDWGDDTIHHWLLGSEILDHVANFAPVAMEAKLSAYQYHNWDRVSEPDCYTPNLDTLRGEKLFQMDHPVVTHATGYRNALWAERFHVAKGVKVTWVGYKATAKVKPVRKRQLDKLDRYIKRLGDYSVHAKWTLSPEQRRESHSEFIDEVRRLVALHGEIRAKFEFR